jgi:hypothetical protein
MQTLLVDEARIVELWRELWDEFCHRAECLSTSASEEPADVIDKAIWWQRSGTAPFCSRELSHEQLHLPELFSGSPWSRTDKWVAVIALNPTISPDERFPTVSMRATHGDEALIQYFENRFSPDFSAKPCPHGGSLDTRPGPVAWHGGDNGEIRATSNRTWTGMEQVLCMALDALGQESSHGGLGRLGSVIDMAPWKFAKWSKLDGESKRDFLEKGESSFGELLRLTKPTVLWVMGSDARKRFAEHCDTKQTKGPYTDMGMHSTYEVPVVGSYHTSAAFSNDDKRTVAKLLANYLR